jgi:hypothetical protein
MSFRRSGMNSDVPSSQGRRESTSLSTVVVSEGVKNRAAGFPLNGSVVKRRVR